MAEAPIPFGDPKKFVSWKFVCKTRAEIVLNTRIANQKLNYFLAGFNAGIVSLGKKKNDYAFKNRVLKPKSKGSTIFLFEPLVFRKTKGGGVDLTTSKVPSPRQPNP